jgi:hypothetical protein
LEVKMQLKPSMYVFTLGANGIGLHY